MTRYQEIPLQGSGPHLTPKEEYSYRCIHISDSIDMGTVGISLCKYDRVSYHSYNTLKPWSG